MRAAMSTALCSELIPAVAASKLADAFDAYCEQMAFTAALVARSFAAARAHGLPVKLHADQLSNMHGAALAAQHGALSADHLEYTDADGVAAHGGGRHRGRAAARGLLFPARAPAPADRRRCAMPRVPMAVATDCNPGTSPLTSILTAMNFAAVEFGLSTEECLAGVTRVAARALGLQATQRHASKSASGATWPSGTWPIRPNWCRASARARCHGRLWHGQPDA